MIYKENDAILGVADGGLMSPGSVRASKASSFVEICGEIQHWNKTWKHFCESLILCPVASSIPVFQLLVSTLIKSFKQIHCIIVALFIFGFLSCCAILDISLESQVWAASVVSQTNRFWSDKSSSTAPFPPWQQLRVITLFLPVSEGDYILPAENQMTNDHAEQLQQQSVWGKADEDGKVGWGGGLTCLHLSKVTFFAH